MSGAQACGNQEGAAAGGTALSLEEQRCNGSLHKKNNLNPAVAVTAEDSGGQRYSADPTIFLGERTTRGDTDEDGYMTPMKDKHSSGNYKQPIENTSSSYSQTHLTTIQDELAQHVDFK